MPINNALKSSDKISFGQAYVESTHRQVYFISWLTRIRCAPVKENRSFSNNSELLTADV